MKLCDNVRDDTLPNLGVRLEDHEGQDTVIKLVDKETLLREREEKLEVRGRSISGEGAFGIHLIWSSFFQMEEKKRLEKEKKKAELAAAQASPISTHTLLSASSVNLNISNLDFILPPAQAAKEAQRRIPPWEMFKNETDKYSEFDDKVGIF